jgi:NADH dehydrogenase [ubiquinone] 1 alpha subcomplex assembly factor 7
MTGASLADRFRRLIAAAGPISLAHYMAESNARYYAGRNPLGSEGDFVTAPEVSQMFGELVGLWLADLWLRAGSPKPIDYVELGPGRGTLARDALRAMARHGLVPQVHLVEGSRGLRTLQREAVPKALFHDDLAQVPTTGPILLVANEFLDALPLRQFIATAEGWRERRIGLGGDALVWGLSAPLPGGCDAPEGAWREDSASADALARKVSARIGEDGGAALFIDYGYRAADRPPGFTLQALRRHVRADPLVRPGEADLTWLIDFDRLADQLAPLRSACAPQGGFLTRLGIGRRAAGLAAARPDQADAIADALERLTATGQMGTLFKALAAWPAGQPRPPGFEETA